MNRHPLRLAALIAVAMALGACAKRSEVPVSSLGEDDDATCRTRGFAVGSNDYVACRRDRDVARGNSNARADRAQRNLGEMMLNNPGRP